MLPFTGQKCSESKNTRLDFGQSIFEVPFSRRWSYTYLPRTQRSAWIYVSIKTEGLGGYLRKEDKLERLRHPNSNDRVDFKLAKVKKTTNSYKIRLLFD